MRAVQSWSMRFALALSAVFAISAITAGGISYVLQTRDLYNRLVSEVQATAESLASVADGGDRAELEERVLAWAQAAGNSSTLVAWGDTATGEVLGSFRPTTPFEGVRDLAVGTDVTLPFWQGPEGPDAVLAFGIGTPLGSVYAARDLAWVTESGEFLLRSMILGLGTALFLTIGLAVFVARRNDARITRMEEVLERVGSGRLAERIGDTGDDDLGRLATGMDVTFDRLEAGVEAVRQVSTDISHDLRAPLARLRLKIEPFAMDSDIPLPLQEASGSILEDIDTLAGTFDAILRLSRLQSGTVELVPSEVDLRDLAKDVHEIMGPVADDHGHELRLSLPTTASVVEVDRDLLLQALVNLVENAILHCHDPARIEIGVGCAQGQPAIWVTDNGPGIAEEDRIRAVERFVRLDESRTTRGSGLGLSLVSTIAALHGGQLELSDNSPGLRADIVLN